jgi:hypothetical protein
VYIIEANPRASRTVPFVAKAIGHPLATYASLLMAGQTLKDLNFLEEPTLNHVAVKEAVLPFEKFQGASLVACFCLACFINLGVRYPPCVLDPAYAHGIHMAALCGA